MTENPRTRLEMARQAASDLLDELETTSAPVAQSLMRAKRLARLLRDSDAQAWLDLELKGYPSGFSFTRLGSCRRYAVEGGRLTPDDKYYLKSLPGIEAVCRTQEDAVQRTGTSAPSATRSVAANFLEANATIHVMAAERKAAADLRTAYTKNHAIYSSLRAAIHSYATDCRLALELGDAAEEIFEAARRDVDSFVRGWCPSAAEQLIAISERMREGNSEAYSAALTSCRRLIAAVADAVFPAQQEDYVDGRGKNRNVGNEQYKNRILAFVEQRITSSSSRQLLISDLEHIAARLDAVYDKACKGVHAEVDEVEARLTVIHTYLFLAEVARVVAPAG